MNVARFCIRFEITRGCFFLVDGLLIGGVEWWSATVTGWSLPIMRAWRIPRAYGALLLAMVWLFSLCDLAGAAAASEEYEHPAGYISTTTVREMREKYREFDWAKKIVTRHETTCGPWVERDVADILAVIPKRRVGVYHLFTCPETKARLDFSPFEDDNFTSANTGKSYRAAEISPVYPESSPHYGTYYDGWGCLFIIRLADTCYRSGLLYQILEESRYAEWVSRVLLYYAEEVIPHLEVDETFGPKRILMYAREGDAIHLHNFVLAYELVRDAGFLSDADKRHIEEDFFRVVCDSAIMDEEYHSDHNNIPHFLGTIIQTGIAIGEPRYLEFGFGYGDYAPEKRPEHRSLAYMADNHFLEDGAHVDICSGYHLYAATPFYRNLFVGHNLSRSNPESFPPRIFDYFSPAHAKSSWVPGVARWASAMATYNGTLPTVGDSMAATASCMTYDPFGEIAYRYCGYREMGLEERIIQGERPDNALIVGVPTIETEAVRTRSANLSSGYAVLKRDGVYAALNALLPGGGHQHADRLNLILYANDRLMSMEKATPYNDMSLRDHSTYSWAHNTVVVDRTSQPQGERLNPKQIPKVAEFLDHPRVGVVRVDGGALYESTRAYNRTVFLIGRIIVDVFHVEGGQTHDFLYHNYGDSLALDVDMAKGAAAFDAPEYLIGGSDEYEMAHGAGNVRATWGLPAVTESVYPLRRRRALMHLTMLPSGVTSKETTYYHLRSHPYEQLKPLTHTFMARRQGPENTFISIFESTLEDEPPRLTNASWRRLPRPGAEIRLDLLDRRLILLCQQGTGLLDGANAQTDGAYALLAYPQGESVPDFAVIGSGSYLRSTHLDVDLSSPTTAVLSRGDGLRWQVDVSASVQYVTVASGNRYPRPCEIEGVLRVHGEKEQPIKARTQSADAGNLSSH